MKRSRFDWSAIELEYTTGDESIRAIAERYEVSFSFVAKKARDGNWDQKRGEYRSRALAVQTEKIIDTMAVKVAAVKADALQVIHAAVLKMGVDLQDRVLSDGTVVPGMQVTPSDLAKLLDRLMPLIGQPNQIQENRNLGLDLTPDVPPDVARLIAELASERGANTRAVGRARLPGRQEPRNN